MSCKGCKYNRDLTLEDVLFCVGCKRAYKKKQSSTRHLKTGMKNKIILWRINMKRIDEMNKKGLIDFQRNLIAMSKKKKREREHKKLLMNF